MIDRPVKSAWERYEDWNTAIAQVVFNEATTGQAVYLDLEPDVLLCIANSAGYHPPVEPVKELIKVVKATLLPPSSSTSIFHNHTVRVQHWATQKLSTPPPCIAMLSTLSLVAEHMEKTEKFAASNYYGLLLKMLDIEEHFRDRVARDFRKETPLLWNTLNRWLEDCNGKYGLPTAIAFDRRRYIGLPLSQALVRAQDRVKLPLLFEQFGLQPNQRVSVHDMQQLLNEWLPSSQVSSSLKNLWSKPTAREKISEVVCAELEGWRGKLCEVPSTEHTQNNNLFLAAELRVHPQLEVDLFLVARQNGKEKPHSITLSSDAPDLANSTLDQPHNGMRLERIAGTQWESIEPSQLIPCSRLLVSNIFLATPEKDQAYVRQAKRLILLKWHETDHLFIEMRRIELVETYLILVIQELADSVREVLQPAARAGYRELTHENLCGLPPNWVAFERVQLERIPDVSVDDLKSLQPIARTHLAIGEGLPLPGMNVWHGSRLPELRIVVDKHNDTGVVHVNAIPTQYIDNGKIINEQLAEIEGAGIVNLSRKASYLRDGDFRIVVTNTRESHTLATAHLRVRSGCYPRRLEDEEDLLIGHALLDQQYFGFFGSQITDPNDRAIRIVGALLDDEICPPIKQQAKAPVPIPIEPCKFIQDAEEEAWHPLEPIAGNTTKELPICFTRGGHHWRIDPQYGKESVYSICKDCGIERWWDPGRWHRAKKNISYAQSKDIGENTIRIRCLPAISEKSKADMDLLLDALSYARTGSWRSFRTIATAINDAPWFAHEAARCLEALGHIELEIDVRSIQPKRWAITPSTIVKPEQGPCFLAGSRSTRLIQAVTEFSEILGGEVGIVQQPKGPNVVEIHGLQTEDIHCISEEINERMCIPLSLSVQPAPRIATQLPSLDTLRRSLPNLTTAATTKLEKFDLNSGHWLSIDQMEYAGAYRLQSRPWIYAVVPKPSAGEQRNVIADVRLAKYLAASDASFALIGYEESRQTLLTPMGAPLPGLLERVAVLCSGRLPIPLQDGTLAYGNVSPEIAEAIWIAATTND